MNKDELDNTIHSEVLFASTQYLSIEISHVHFEIMDFGYHQKFYNRGNLLRKKPSFGLIRQCRLIAGLHSGFSRPGFSWERVRTLSVFWTFVRESQLSRIVGHGRLVR